MNKLKLAIAVLAIALSSAALAQVSPETKEQLNFWGQVGANSINEINEREKAQKAERERKQECYRQCDNSYNACSQRSKAASGEESTAIWGQCLEENSACQSRCN